MDVKCPTCKAPTRFDVTNPTRPFCSERCRTIDLGAWANESYRVPESEVTTVNQNGEIDRDPEQTRPPEPQRH